MQKKEFENVWIQDIIKEEIEAQTNFDKSKIELIVSKRLPEDTPGVNYHEFKYENELYTLVDGELKSNIIE